MGFRKMKTDGGSCDPTWWPQSETADRIQSMFCPKDQLSVRKSGNK